MPDSEVHETTVVPSGPDAIRAACRYDYEVRRLGYKQILRAHRKEHPGLTVDLLREWSVAEQWRMHALARGAKSAAAAGVSVTVTPADGPVGVPTIADDSFNADVAENCRQVRTQIKRALEALDIPLAALKELRRRIDTGDPDIGAAKLNIGIAGETAKVLKTLVEAEAANRRTYMLARGLETAGGPTKVEIKASAAAATAATVDATTMAERLAPYAEAARLGVAHDGTGAETGLPGGDGAGEPVDPA